jgi:hypothetical protein
VSYPFWTGLRVEKDGYRFSASVDILSRGRVLQFLRKSGWDIR